jgi:quercetin dioxygenase-like cupin family protein
MSRSKTAFRVTASFIFAAACMQIHPANAQLVGAKGLSSKPLAEVSIASENEPVQERKLRSRMVSLDAGGSTPVHSHKDRPSLIYVVQGTLSEERNGAVKEYGPGESIPVGREVTHLIQNKGTGAASFIETDITK